MAGVPRCRKTSAGHAAGRAGNVCGYTAAAVAVPVTRLDSNIIPAAYVRALAGHRVDM
jgi:hypothetical protein